MKQSRFTKGQTVIAAVCHTGEMKNCGIFKTTIEEDGGSYYVLAGHGVFSDNQVFECNLDAITWLREKLEQHAGFKLREANRLAQRAEEIGKGWQAAYETCESHTVPECAKSALA